MHSLDLLNLDTKTNLIIISMQNLFFYIVVIIFQLITIVAFSQQSTKIDCRLYIETIEKNDTLVIKSEVWHHNRLEEFEEVTIYYANNNLIALVKGDYLMNNTVISDTIISLNKIDFEKIKGYEYSVRNQKLESNQIGFSGRYFKYELSFKQGKISYFSNSSYFSLCKELLPD